MRTVEAAGDDVIDQMAKSGISIVMCRTAKDVSEILLKFQSYRITVAFT